MRFFKLAVSAVVASGTIAGVGTASAADMAPRYTKAPSVSAVAPIGWTGCYVGAEAGYGWGRESSIASTGTVNPGATVAAIKPDGGLAGGTIGCNWQTSNVVFGIENDISASGLSGSANALPPFNTTFPHAVSTTWLDTLRGRVGLTWDRALLYATAGVAFTNVRDAATGGGAAVSARTTRSGWTAGIGMEYLFSPQWSAKVEYLYADFGTLHEPFDVLTGGFFVGVNTHLTENIVRAGVNYHWNWAGPVVAKY
jgi:outer membrane immunogenic protein